MVRSITTSETQTTTHVANTRSVRTIIPFTVVTLGSKRAPDVSGYQEQFIERKTTLAFAEEAVVRVGVIWASPILNHPINIITFAMALAVTGETDSSV